MLLARQGGQQDPGRPGRRLQGHHGVAQRALDHLGVEVFLVHRQPAFQPRLPDQHVHGGDALDQGARQPPFIDHAHQRVPQPACVLAAQQVEPGVDILGLRRGFPPRLHLARRLRRSGRRQREQAFQRQRNNLAGSVSGVDQPADVPQPGEVVVGVAALALRVAPGLRKPVAALPHPQGVLAQAGVALDIGNGVGGGG